MKKALVLSALFCLLLATVTIFAQEKTANFAGNWELDVNKSNLGERMRVKSMTMTVAQTDKELRIETTAIRSAPPEGEMPKQKRCAAPAKRIMTIARKGRLIILKAKKQLPKLTEDGQTAAFNLDRKRRQVKINFSTKSMLRRVILPSPRRKLGNFKTRQTPDRETSSGFKPQKCILRKKIRSALPVKIQPKE